MSQLIPQKDTTPPDQALALAIIENHYFVNNCWLKEGHILQHIQRLKHIPITIVHGRYDVVCPITQAFDIKRALPHTKLRIVTEAGHASSHPDIKKELRRATNGKCRNCTRKRSI